MGAGVDALRELAKDYPLDLERVAAVGHSAGGQLVLWLAARTKLADASLRGDDPLPLQGVVSLAGVTDLKRALDEDVCDDMAAQLLGAPPTAAPDRYAQASPIELVPLGVRQHIITGARDAIVPSSFGRDYASAAERAGDRVSFTELADAGHFELVAPNTSAWSTVEAAVREAVSR